MSRPICFRAWHEGRKKWLHGGKAPLGGCHILGETIWAFGEWCRVPLVELDQVVVEQFTGLKDCTGVNIYEGDIIRSANVSYEPTAVVVYVDYEARFAPCEIEAYLTGTRDGDLFNQPGEPWLLSECGVIGNIHENPDLIKP